MSATITLPVMDHGCDVKVKDAKRLAILIVEVGLDEAELYFRDLQHLKDFCQRTIEVADRLINDAKFDSASFEFKSKA